MADNTSFDSYKGSGFYESSNSEALKNEAASIPTSDAALREQAVNQYADTYDRLDSSLSKQLTSLITSQATDEQLLRDQYNNSISSMMAQLQKRGLHVTPSLPAAQTAALNKHRNDVMTMRQGVYQIQRNLPEQQRALLKTDYEKAIAQRIAANRATNVPTVSSLLANMAELQSSSYIDYINNLLAKKSGGGGRRYSSVPNKNNDNDKNDPKVDLSGYVHGQGMIGNYGAGSWSLWYRPEE